MCRLLRTIVSSVKKLTVKRIVCIQLFIIIVSCISSAQDLVNTGTITNNGVLKVKNQLVGLPSEMKGTVELIGSDQSLPAANYKHVRLMGTGTKTTTGGNLSISGNLTIATPVTLNIAKGNMITLGDTLFELGILKGAIKKTVNLTGDTTSSTFGNIGKTISWISNAPGSTSVLRASDSVQFGNGQQSIRRYYEIQPTDATAIGTVVFKFADSELNGQDINNLQLWRSADNGSTWQRHIPVVDTLLKTLTKSNVPLKGLWTATDTTHALGPLNGGAGIPASIANANTVPNEQVILTTLDTLKVLITDIFGSPVNNVAVKFEIDSMPAPNAGAALSNINVVTNSSGIASTLFMLGNKVGTYEVIATSPNLDTVRMTVKAKHGAAQSLDSIPIPLQVKPILTQLDTAFTVVVSDIGGNPVDSALVQFAIVHTPSGSFGDGLTAQSTRTDISGHASTRLTLGSKIGQYTVSAKIAGVSDTVTFIANATVGAPDQLAISGGINQSGENGKPLNDPFIVTVLDQGGNPVPNDTIEFRILTVPSNGAQLSSTGGITNSLGQASTVLTLGTKVGNYLVGANSTTLGQSQSLSFVGNALAGSASVLASIQGNNQSAVIGQTLTSEFVVQVRDANGNNVPQATVMFSIDSIPNLNSIGQSISNTADTTDTSGLATTRLTLGNKVGEYKVNARVNDNLIVSFIASARPGAAVSFTQLSGNGQSAQIITQLQNEIVLHLSDIGGNGVPGSTVQFSIDAVPVNATGQRLIISDPTSDVNGTVRATFILGNKVGTYRIRVRSAGISDTIFTAIALHGAAVAMVPNVGLNQTKPIFTPLDIPFTVRVVDIGENAVPLTNIRFAVIGRPAGDTSAILSRDSQPSDSSGFASSQLTLGSKVGTYSVRAFTATPAQNEAADIEGKKGKKTSNKIVGQALLETIFTAQATNGTAATMMQIFGDHQVNPTETELDTAFVVTIRDRGNNPVPNDTVFFRMASAPEFAKKQTLRDSLTLSDSNGNAKTFLRLGERAGTYSVNATVGNVPSKMFSANAYYVYGDINKDIEVNIADITSLVDFINNKITLSTSDSIKADYNHDGNIDTTDIAFIRETLLSRSLLTHTLLPSIFVDENVYSEFISPVVASKKKVFDNASTVFEATQYGLRINMVNTVPVRGMELRLTLKDSTKNITSTNLIMKRAEPMQVYVSTQNKEVRVIVYNLQNNEIQPGSGSLFRLPMITSQDMIDSMQVIFALISNTSIESHVEKVTAPVNTYPTTFRLSQNYPNPFNGSTTIQYDIPDGMHQTKMIIQVYNLLGQKIKTLVYEEQDPGRYTVKWDGTDQNGRSVSSGVYFYRLLSKAFVESKKMLYVK